MDEIRLFTCSESFIYGNGGYKLGIILKSIKRTRIMNNNEFLNNEFYIWVKLNR